MPGDIFQALVLQAQTSVADVASYKKSVCKSFACVRAPNMKPVDSFAGVCTYPQSGLRTPRWTGANLLQGRLVLKVRPGPAKQNGKALLQRTCLASRFCLARRKGNPALQPPDCRNHAPLTGLAFYGNCSWRPGAEAAVGPRGCSVADACFQANTYAIQHNKRPKPSICCQLPR